MANNPLPLELRGDFSQYPARIDLDTKQVFINTGVVPPGLEKFWAVHEITEIDARKDQRKWEQRAHNLGIKAEYQVAKENGKLEEQHQSAVSILKFHLREAKKHGWKATEEIERDLVFRKNAFEQLVGK